MEMLKVYDGQAIFWAAEQVLLYVLDYHLHLRRIQFKLNVRQYSGVG